MAFFGADGRLTGDAGQLFWDEVTRKLGINTDSPSISLDLVGNVIRFGQTQYPADQFDDTPNTYAFLDRGDTDSDATFVPRHQGNARGEIGLLGDSDLARAYDIHVKTATGTYPDEVYTSQLVFYGDLGPNGEPVGTANFFNGPLRRYANSGIAMIIAGSSNGFIAPDGKGAALELSYSFDNNISRITSIEHDLFYRDIVYEANNHRWAAGPVNLHFDCFLINSKGAVIVGAPVQPAASADISNPGDAGIGLMDLYTIGQVLTALGGIGTPPTFTLTHLQASATINAPGSGGTNGVAVFTIATGATGTQPQFNGTVSGGALASIDSWVTHGDLTTDPASLTGVAITGAGLIGGTVNLKMGAKTVAMVTPGTLTKAPVTPVSTSSSGPGINATLDITYQNGLGTINVENAIWLNGKKILDAAAVQPTVSGSVAGNAALASLLAGLAGYGLIIDGTSP